MKRPTHLPLFLVFLLGLADAKAQTGSPDPQKLAPDLETALAASTPGQMLSVIVHLTEQADLTPFSSLPRAARLTGVIRALQATANGAQRDLRTLLRQRQAQGTVASFTPFWVFDGLQVTATPAVIQELATRSEVLTVTPDEIEVVPLGVPAAPPEANLALIRAPELWSLGLLGQGIVVANLDSGVDASHPVLAPGWRGGTNSWYDPYGQHSIPADPTGHGTLTMGVMAAADTGASAVGIAPEAQWIAAKIFNDSGSGTATAIHASFQWLLDPDSNPATPDAPDVVNNSWSFANPGCNLEFQPDLQSLRAAGLLPVFAAGNFGPGSNTSVSPANYPEAFAVGATDNTDQLYSYSSEGPSACGETSTLYPELVAPGVDILSTDLFGQYSRNTGTSLAAPHVAGTLALLLSAFPDLSANQQASALTGSAVDLGDPGPDNRFGFGRLDALAAYTWAGTQTGPITSGVSLSPSPASGTVPVHVTASVHDNSANVIAAEGFIDAVGAQGTGFPLLASDGAFDSPTEAVYTDIAPATLATLGEGSHNFSVRGRNAAGLWGDPSPGTLVVDRTGPAIGTLKATPNPTGGAASVSLTALATDALSRIAAAEWFEGSDPGPGLGSPMAAADGAFDTQTEALAATPNVTGWTVGNHSLSVRAKDAAGNWGAASSLVLAVSAATSPDALFADGFESGGLSAWSAVVDSGGSLSVTQAAKQAGVYGLQARITKGNGGYVVDNTPSNEPSYHARFYFHPNGVTASSTAHDLLVGLNGANHAVFRVQLRSSGGQYQIGALVSRKRGTTATSWYPIGNGYHPIEIAWQSGTSSAFGLYIDGALKQTLTGLDTSAYTLETVQMGPQGSLSKVSGTEYFDSFASTRTTLIGP